VLTGDASGNKNHSPLLLIGNEAKNVWAESYVFEARPSSFNKSTT
jgi:hypothetical protein